MEGQDHVEIAEDEAVNKDSIFSYIKDGLIAVGDKSRIIKEVMNVANLAYGEVRNVLQAIDRNHICLTDDLATIV